MKAACVLLCAVLLNGQTKPVAVASVKPAVVADSAKAKSGEVLHYNVNWPSGLSLGEGELTSVPGESGWSYSFSVEAAIPGYTLSERARSSTNGKGCSIEFEKDGVRGQRKMQEKTVFDLNGMKATRETRGGGKADVSTSPCAKDALAFLYFVRGELAAGRLPQAQKVYYGSAYQISVRYTGTQKVRIGSEMIDADHLLASIKGPSADTAIDLFFARDAGRTPLLVQAPLAMGKFSLELAR